MQRNGSNVSVLWRRLAMVLALQLLIVGSRAASATTTTRTTNRNKSKFPQPGLAADPFVQASPLICAVVCQEGVLVVAAHVNVNDEEPLLYYAPQNEGKDVDDDADNVAFCSFLDLPPKFQGPFRIHSIDTLCTILVSAGWRADCDRLVAKCRRIADEERALYGGMRLQDDDAASSSPLYARYLAMELSLYLAQCAVSERTRTMSCASLLIAPPSKSNKPGQVWLVDMTGATSVRALCIGGGVTSDGAFVADAVNRRLLDEEWTSMTTESALETLLRVFRGSAPPQQQGDANHPRLVAENTRLEIALLKSSSRSMARRKLSSFTFIHK